MSVVQSTIKFPAKKSLLSASKKEKENSGKNSRPKSSRNNNLKSPLKVISACNQNETTPTKRKSIEGNDGLSPSKLSRNEDSPSQLISNVCLVTPESKKKFLLDCSKPSARASLFPESPDGDARKALHRGSVSSLPGREDKIDELTTFLLDCLEDRKSKSVYISGQPGTGKTASINYVTELSKISSCYKTVYINCTGLKSSSAIFSAIGKKLCVKTGSSKSEKAYQTAILKYLASAKKMTLLVLDEQDELVSKGQQVLYSLLEWISLVPNGLVMIGIANCLDLIDRALPRLATSSFKPHLIHFSPYTAKQITDIITQRLQQAGTCEDLFEEGALHLLASKVATVSGDVRRALDITNRILQEADGKISLCSVMSTFGCIYSTSETLNQCDEAFPLQQKIVVCTLLLIRTKSNKKDTTIGKVHDVYKKICDRKKISSLDMSEFISLLQLVESRGVIKLQGKTKNRTTKVVLQWDEREITSALKDKELLSSIINDGSYI